GRPRRCRPSIRAPEARPAAPSPPLEKGRSFLVGSGWSPLPRLGRGSERRARVVLDRHPCRLRPAAWLTSVCSRGGRKAPRGRYATLDDPAAQRGTVGWHVLAGLRR